MSERIMIILKLDKMKKKKILLKKNAYTKTQQKWLYKKYDYNNLFSLHTLKLVLLLYEENKV